MLCFISMISRHRQALWFVSFATDFSCPNPGLRHCQEAGWWPKAPSPHCTSGEESQNGHSQDIIAPEWLQASAGNRNAHRVYEMSGRDLWTGKGATFITVLVCPQGQAEAECQGKGWLPLCYLEVAWDRLQGREGAVVQPCAPSKEQTMGPPLSKNPHDAAGAGPLGLKDAFRVFWEFQWGKRLLLPWRSLSMQEFSCCCLKYVGGRSQSNKKPMLWPATVPCVHVNIVSAKGSTCFVWGDIIPAELLTTFSVFVEERRWLLGPGVLNCKHLPSTG